jgi:hypothetical protein
LRKINPYIAADVPDEVNTPAYKTYTMYEPTEILMLQSTSKKMA